MHFTSRSCLNFIIKKRSPPPEVMSSDFRFGCCGGFLYYTAFSSLNISLLQFSILFQIVFVQLFQCFSCFWSCFFFLFLPLPFFIFIILKMGKYPPFFNVSHRITSPNMLYYTAFSSFSIACSCLNTMLRFRFFLFCQSRLLHGKRTARRSPLQIL